MQLPRYQLAKISPSISRWLGYRSSAPKPLPFYIVALWSFVGAFCGVSLIQASYRLHYSTQRAVPVIASFGASAVLIYGAIDRPLAQPRALIGGHFISALLGVCISKLIQLLPPKYRIELQWLAGSLSVSLALVAMELTGTVHPPAGATALLAVVNQNVIDLSWYLLPVALLSSTLALILALFIDNIHRRYPVFWFTAGGLLSVAPPACLRGHDSGKVISSVAGVNNGSRESL